MVGTISADNFGDEAALDAWSVVNGDIATFDGGFLISVPGLVPASSSCAEDGQQ